MNEALNILTFTKRKAAIDIKQLLESAIAIPPIPRPATSAVISIPIFSTQSRSAIDQIIDLAIKNVFQEFSKCMQTSKIKFLH